jgi:hypothetical protein
MVGKRGRRGGGEPPPRRCRRVRELPLRLATTLCEALPMRLPSARSLGGGGQARFRHAALKLHPGLLSRL